MNPITETLLLAKEVDEKARMTVGVCTSYTAYPFRDVLYVSIHRHGRVLEDCGQWGDIGLFFSKSTEAYVFGPIDADPAVLAQQLITALQGAPAVAP